MMWALHKGGQVTSMQKDLKSIRKMEAENQRLKLDKRRQDAMNDKDEREEESKK